MYEETQITFPSVKELSCKHPLPSSSKDILHVSAAEQLAIKTSITKTNLKNMPKNGNFFFQHSINTPKGYVNQTMIGSLKSHSRNKIMVILHLLRGNCQEEKRTLPGYSTDVFEFSCHFVQQVEKKRMFKTNNKKI